MISCQACDLYLTCDGPVEGEGPMDAEIVLIGEAPGEVENDIGRPFQGDAGKLLRQQLQSIGIDPDTLYITNICKCRPPDNRTPYKVEMDACRLHLQEELNRIKPRLIILCGATALRAFLPKEKLKSCHGVAIVRDDVTYFPMFHPAAGMHSPQSYSYFINDIQSLGRHVKGNHTKINTDNHYRFVSINDKFAIKMLQRRYTNTLVVAFDFETETTDVHKPNIVGVSLCSEDNKAHFIYASHSYSDQLSIIRFLKPIVENPAIIKVCHNLKYESSILYHHGVEVVNGKDTMLAAYLLNNKPGSLGLKSLARRYLGVEPVELEDLMGKGKKQIAIRDVSIKELANYSCADADNTFQLYNLFYPQLVEQGLDNHFNEIECPLTGVLTEMEYRGVKVDTTVLGNLGKPWAKRMEELDKEIQDMVGHPFNIRSTMQLGEVLFGELGLPVLSTTVKKKQPAVSDEVMRQLKDKHPVINFLIEYSDLKTRLRTFVEGLTNAVNPSTGRVHTSFNQTIVPTNRLSSSGPNLQNQPARDEEAKVIRSAFVPSKPKYVILKADFSGQELRVLAHYSQDERFLATYRNGGDAHQDIMDKTGLDRDKSKIVNFGVVYGISEYGLSDVLGTNTETARGFLEDYFTIHPGVATWREAVWEEAEDLGYVTTISGFRRWIPEIQSTNRRIIESGKKYAVNTIVQGSGAVLTKVAMINIHRALKHSKLQAAMLLQVHDELVFEVHIDDLMELATLVHYHMVNCWPLSVPLDVELKSGPSWGETKPLKLDV